jgi:hypothetical protein
LRPGLADGGCFSLPVRGTATEDRQRIAFATPRRPPRQQPLSTEPGAIGSALGQGNLAAIAASAVSILLNRVSTSLSRLSASSCLPSIRASRAV